MKRWLGRVFEGAGPFPVVALVLAAVGVMFLILTLASIEGLVWTGQAVHGNEQGGIILYSYRGTNYSFDDSGSNRTGPRTLYIDTSDPSRAVLKSPASVALDVLTVGGPMVGALCFAAEAVRRKRRYVRRRRANLTRIGEEFGGGLDPETIRRLIARQQADVQVRKPPTR